MSAPLVTKKRADLISILIFVVGCLILFYCNSLWPGVILLIGGILAQRQYLRGRRYDIVVTFFVFAGFFVTYTLPGPWIWSDLFPVLFATGGLYMVLREFLVGKTRDSRDEVEELAQEIEDEQREEHPH